MKRIHISASELSTWPIDPSADFSQLLNAVKKCDGDVYFLSHEGDALNLKSSLSQYLFAILISNDEMRLGGRLGLKKESDLKSLSGFVRMEEE